MNRLDLAVHDATTPIDVVREDLVRRGVSIVRVVDDARAALIEDRTSHVPSLLRTDGGTPHGSRCIGGIAKRYGAACDPAIAEVRVMDEIRELFASLYGLGADEVMTGWDAVAITGNDAGRVRPPTQRALEHAKAQKAYKALTNTDLPPHIDIGVRTIGARVEERMKDLHPILPCCVQGQYVVTSVPSGGATLVVSPGEYVDAPPNSEWFDVEKRDFCPCTSAGYEALRGTWRAVEAPRGCVILWLSRLPHGNKLADFGVDPRRFVIFVSWQARALVSDEAERRALKRKKMDAVETGATTDHWSTHAVKVYRGSHYSNGAGTTRVVYSADHPPVLSDALRAKIEAAF